MPNYNPWETDTTDASFIEAVNTLADDAIIALQIADPNNAEQGLWRKITGANLKNAVRSLPSSKSTHSDLTTSDATILQNINDNDRIEVYFKEIGGSNYYTDSWTFRFGDLTSVNTRRVISASGNNFAILYKKSGTSLVMRRGGGLNSSNFMRLSVYTNFYA